MTEDIDKLIERLTFDIEDGTVGWRWAAEAATALKAIQAEKSRWEKLAGENFHAHHRCERRLALAEAEVERLRGVVDDLERASGDVFMGGVS